MRIILALQIAILALTVYFSLQTIEITERLALNCDEGPCLTIRCESGPSCLYIVRTGQSAGMPYASEVMP